MRWKSGRRSSNVEDRRSQGGFSRGGGSAASLAPLLGLLFKSKNRKLILLLLVVGFVVFKLNPNLLLGGGQGYDNAPQPTSAQSDEYADFTKVVLGDTEDTWNALFRQQGMNYPEPTLVMFRGSVSSACGAAQSAMGPFYCPLDQKVYIDLSFYEDLKRRHSAPGDFAQAYVIAHEVGHHIQTVLGISEKVHKAKQRLSKEKANVLSVRQELQADCLAGVWAHHAHKRAIF